MTNHLRRRRGLPLAMAVACSLGASAGAAAEEAAGVDPAWAFGAEIYLWGATITGETTAGDEVRIDFSDLFDNLNFGVMGTLVAQRDKLTLFADAIYLDAEGDRRTTANIVGSSVTAAATLDLKGFITTAGAAYEVFSSGSTGLGTTSIDALGGARVLWLESDLDFDLAGGSASASESGTNVDAVVGARGRTDLTDRLYLTYYADVGTGQSNLTWQALAGLNYSFKRVDLVGGYRYLSWNFQDRDTFDNLKLHGPFLGVKFGF
ncbi:MAG: hypothetical protein AAFX81_12055 [Pseudomonadota bacterium]